MYAVGSEFFVCANVTLQGVFGRVSWSKNYIAISEWGVGGFRSSRLAYTSTAKYKSQENEHERQVHSTETRKSRESLISYFFVFR